MFNVMFKGYPIDTAHTLQQAIGQLNRERAYCAAECKPAHLWTVESGNAVVYRLPQERTERESEAA